MDILLRKVVEANDDNQPLCKEDKSVLQKKAHEDFNAKTERIPNEDGTFRYKIKLTRLPDHLYPPKVDGKKISGMAINRFIPWKAN